MTHCLFCESQLIMLAVKIACIGKGVGKSCLVITYDSGTFPDGRVRGVRNYVTKKILNGTNSQG